MTHVVWKRAKTHPLWTLPLSAVTAITRSISWSPKTHYSGTWLYSHSYFALQCTASKKSMGHPSLYGAAVPGQPSLSSLCAERYHLATKKHGSYTLQCNLKYHTILFVGIAEISTVSILSSNQNEVYIQMLFSQWLKTFCEARRASHCHSPQTTYSSKSTCCAISAQNSAMHVVVYAGRLTSQRSIVEIINW